MSPTATFFAFGFVSTFAVALLATWFQSTDALAPVKRA